LARSAAHEQRRRRRVSAAEVSARRRPGPIGALPDSELLAEIRLDLEFSPFVGEGHRKVWARLRRERGIRTSRKRMLRLTREAGLLAPNPAGAQALPAAARGHDHRRGPEHALATDATEAWTRGEARCAVFVLVDHALRAPVFLRVQEMSRLPTTNVGSSEGEIGST